MSAKNTWCQQNKIIIIKNWWNSGFWMRRWSEKYINNKNLITSHFCPWSWICIINIITQKFAHDKIIGGYTKYTLQKMLLLKILYNAMQVQRMYQHCGLQLQIDLLCVRSVPITDTVVSSIHTHNEVYSIQHYETKIVSELCHINGFLSYLRFSPLIQQKVPL